ncbi:IS30 family transposase [Nocardioides allogilvus]|uniref:IS30 family transposase n=1 Tax=Nocardioides allogilvus TaxID=2072017 RepID=UPI000D30F358|nr:IS30 family transposase [Nocardioides allogilvus]
MPKTFPVEVREAFVELICGGVSLRQAAERTGVSSTQAVAWWSQSGHMNLRLVLGPHGGLGSVQSLGSVVGGVRRALSIDDRVEIAAGVHKEWTLQCIADAIGRDKSVVCRELSRNRSPDGVYRASVAHCAAAVRRPRPKTSKLAANPGLCRRIEAWMDDGWSPRLISQMLARDAASDTDRVSHETIYQALYVQTRGSLRADLHRCLSLKRSRRKAHGSTRNPASPYKEAFKISERPAEVADRAVPGHWEGDLIMGGTASGSAIGTLVERSTRFTILLHLPGRHDSNAVAEAMIREMGKLPEHLRRSVTWDRGVELAKYADIQTALDLQLYFCDPHSPWQRGTNENTNRLLRHWFEKGSDLSIHTAEDLARIAATLNARPRPTLDLHTPAQRLNELLRQAAA